MKTCRICGQVKPQDQFARDRTRKSGYDGRCRPCNAERVRMAEKRPGTRCSHARQVARYGLTPDDYARLVAEQAGVCAICRQHERDGKRLAVDHDHETGRVRGLLCGDCNRAIGMMRDDPQRLRAAASYLD